MIMLLIMRMVITNVESECKGNKNKDNNQNTDESKEGKAW